MSELKECPFCGIKQLTDEEAEEIVTYIGQTRVCDNCGATAKDWNTRPIEDALQARIAELKDKQRWIPVSERLPDDGDEVIIWAQNDWEAATFLNNGVYGLPVWETLRNFDYELNTFDLVTHWKERPEPPEDSNNEPA